MEHTLHPLLASCCLQVGNNLASELLAIEHLKFSEGLRPLRARGSLEDPQVLRLLESSRNVHRDLSISFQLHILRLVLRME